jgi:hypothetical protein
MKHILYIYQMLGYAKTGPIKVGITKNLRQRERQLNGARMPELLGYFEFPNEISAFHAEQRIITNFDAAYGREYLNAAAAEVVAYAKEICAPLQMGEVPDP